MSGKIPKPKDWEHMSDIDYILDNDPHLDEESLKFTDRDFESWDMSGLLPADIRRKDAREGYEAYLAAHKK